MKHSLTGLEKLKLIFHISAVRKLAFVISAFHCDEGPKPLETLGIMTAYKAHRFYLNVIFHSDEVPKVKTSVISLLFLQFKLLLLLTRN